MLSGFSGVTPNAAPVSTGPVPFGRSTSNSFAPVGSTDTSTATFADSPFTGTNASGARFAMRRSRISAFTRFQEWNCRR